MDLFVFCQTEWVNDTFCCIRLCLQKIRFVPQPLLMNTKIFFIAYGFHTCSSNACTACVVRPTVAAVSSMQSLPWQLNRAGIYTVTCSVAQNSAWPGDLSGWHLPPGRKILLEHFIQKLVVESVINTWDFREQMALIHEKYQNKLVIFSNIK